MTILTTPSLTSLMRYTNVVTGLVVLSVFSYSVVVLGANRVVVSELSPGIVIGDVSVVTCVVMLSVLSTG